MNRAQRYFRLIISVFRGFKEIFVSDSKLISEEVSEILSNPLDTQKYKEAIKQVEETNEKVTITLSNNKTLTLVN